MERIDYYAKEPSADGACW